MNAFEQLYGIIGEVTQEGKTYATAPIPPAGDDSTKVATTAWVKDVTPSIPSGNVAVWSRDFSVTQDRATTYLRAPSGGTWFCWGTVDYAHPSYKIRWTSNGVVVSGNEILESGTCQTTDISIITNNGLCIKTA